MRVNYRNLPQQIKRASVAPKPRTRAGLPPRNTVGSAMSSVAPSSGLMGLTANIQQPAAGKPVSPVAAANPILNPGADAGGTAGTAMRGRARVGGSGYRSLRK